MKPVNQADSRHGENANGARQQGGHRSWCVDEICLFGIVPVGDVPERIAKRTHGNVLRSHPVADGEQIRERLHQRNLGDIVHHDIVELNQLVGDVLRLGQRMARSTLRGQFRIRRWRSSRRAGKWS